MSTSTLFMTRLRTYINKRKRNGVNINLNIVFQNAESVTQSKIMGENKFITDNLNSFVNNIQRIKLMN